MKKLLRSIEAAGIVTISSVLFSRLVYAQAGSPPATVTLTDPLGGGESFSSVVANVSAFLFTDIAIPLATIMILVGAFQFMTAGGDTEKVSKARKTITYAAVGFALALLASGIADIIKSILLGQ